MKTIGLLGGMSWESTLSYYKSINENIKEELGGLHSAKIVLYSVDFHEVEVLQHKGRWDEAAKLLAQAAIAIEAAGADFLVICTNTMHKVAEQIQTSIKIPILHIADATAYRLAADGVNKVALLGTQFTMEQDFYKNRLIENFGIEVIVPDKQARLLVHEVIYKELCLGKIKPSSREQYLRIIAELQRQGAEAIILGCTEIALLIQPSHSPIALYDTVQIHALAATKRALSKDD